MQRTDVAIIGAGPIGIELAVRFKREGIDYVQFDAKQVGATMQWWPQGTRWFSSNDRIAIAGVPLITPGQEKATREEYLAYLRQIVTQFDLDVRTYEPVTDIDREDGGFVVTTEPAAGTTQTFAKRIVLATGGTDRPRKLDIPGADLPQVLHYYDDPHTFFRRKVLILGGKNSAVETALRCHHVGAKVSLAHRQDALPESSIKYWLMPEMKGLLKRNTIEGYFNAEAVKITPTHVTLKRTVAGSDETFDVEADFVLAMIGYEQDNRLFRLAGIELTGDDQRPAFDEATMQTNIPGIYVAGTAMGGTQQKYRVFLENCHVHIDKITAALKGETSDAEYVPTEIPES
ncbi:MAG: NAD(P)-binding domain-containing protein [Planctomycetota bacterium]